MSRGTLAEREQAVDPRIEERRRQVALDRRRRLARRALVALVLLAVPAGLYGLTRTAALDVDRIDVVGAGRTSAEQIEATAGIALGDPLLDVDGERVAARIESLPWVATAQVRRVWAEGRVVLLVTERQPVAVVAHPDRSLLVDATGRVLVVAAPGEALPEAQGLLTVEGLPAAEAGDWIEGDVAAGPLRVAGAITQGVRSRVASVRVEGEELRLVLTPRGEVRFGTATEVDEKVRTLQTTFAETQLDCLAVIDVRVADTAVLTRDPACE